MLRASVFASAFASLIILVVPQIAHAQYKNTSFGLDAGIFLITKPPLTDTAGQPLPDGRRPIRLANGLRVGGEANFKMHDDHLWFSGRLNSAFLRYGAGTGGSGYEQDFDTQGAKYLGTIVGLEGQAAIRYVILTDRVRPYLQVGVSYMHLFSFTGDAGSDCVNLPDMCTGTTTYGNAFLPHNNILAAHFEPGVEFVIARDVAIHLLFDLQRWVVINADDNNALTIGLGMTFFG